LRRSLAGLETDSLHGFEFEEREMLMSERVIKAAHVVVFAVILLLGIMIALAQNQSASQQNTKSNPIQER
jgi:hypothetical protein